MLSKQQAEATREGLSFDSLETTITHANIEISAGRGVENHWTTVELRPAWTTPDFANNTPLTLSMPTPVQGVTMADVAAAAGVARSTVSKALRNDPRIPVSRCRQIQRIANELGYRPHPLVAALMSQIHGHRRSTDPYSLSWIDLWSPEKRNPLAPFADELLAGARTRAGELSYQIEVHRVEPAQLSPGRLKDILEARMQWGVIVPPVPFSSRDIRLDIRRFASVTIGTSLRTPSMHRVTSDHYQGMQLAYDQTRAMGHQAIGLVLGTTVNDRTNGKWLAAYLERQQASLGRPRLAPLVMPEASRTELTRWLKKYRPDAIFVAEPSWAEMIQEIAGASAPQLVWLVTERQWTGVCGLDHQPKLLGAAAVDLVVAQIHRNERGSPEIAHTLLINNRWIDRRS